MSTNTARSIPILIRRCIIQALSLSVLVAILLSFVYGFIYYYQQKQAHLQQIAEILANSASTPDGASRVARQVKTLLSSDSTLQSISFYSTDQPISSPDQANSDRISQIWKNALFTDDISFSQAVTSRYISGDNQDTLMGYIIVTLEVDKLRANWLRNILPLWLATMLIGIISLWFILRKLKWPTKDITELAQVCDMIIKDPDCKQLPVIQQHFELEELSRIKQAFIVVFDRLRGAQQDYDELSDFEQQLQNKDLSLDMQRHNFQSMITHELKTSLNAITGGLQLLEDQYLDQEQRDTLAIISKGSRRLDSTLEQIIQLNKIEKGHARVNLVEFKPLEVIARLLIEFESLAKRKGIELISSVQHTDYTLEGDVEKIEQILSALIDNAIKFTSQGQVIIESQLVHFRESIRWNLKVIDTGIGIDTNYIEDIFTPFFQVDPTSTRAYEGAGIGLPIVKQMLHLIGATIEVSSEIDKGSQFIVMIPLRYRAQSKQQWLEGLKVVQYSSIDNGFLATETQRLGATVTSHQHAQLIVEEVVATSVDIIMIGEDITPKRAAQLAIEVRDFESSHRPLIIYWYAQYDQLSLESYSYGLKASGIDYCYDSTRNSKEFYKQLKRCLTWL